MSNLAIRDHSDFRNQNFFENFRCFNPSHILRMFNLFHGLLKSVFFGDSSIKPIFLKKTCCCQKLKITCLKKPVIVNNNKIQTSLFKENMLLSKNLQTNLFEENLSKQKYFKPICLKKTFQCQNNFKPICLKKTCQCQKYFKPICLKKTCQCQKYFKPICLKTTCLD